MWGHKTRIRGPGGSSSRRKGLRALRRDASGATIVEFALVAAPLIALMLAALEVALAFFVQEALETSVEAAARSIVTGQTQASDTLGASQGMTPAQLQERFRQSACATLPRFLSCSNLMVDVQSADTFAHINTTTPTITYDANGNVTNSFAYTTGGQGSIVIVRLLYLWPVQTGPLGFSLSNTGTNTHLMVATSVAKTEAST